MEKAELKERENQIAEMATTFCKSHIDKEYATLCEKMVRKLGRKRTNPLERGRIEIWAAATVYAIATMNFLFDKSFEPYIPSSTIHEYFRTKQSSVTQKAAQIRKILKLSPLWDKDFSTKYMLKNNPLNNMSMLNGFFFLGE